MQALKEQDIYLVAQVSCLIDDLLSERAATYALRTVGGAALRDDQGGWMDPYSPVVVDYLTELCTELAGYGFDEILLKAVSLPVTETAISYSVQLTSVPTATSAVCTLAQTLSQAVREEGVFVSAIIDSAPLVNGQLSQSGQNLELFAKVFDRLCCWAGTAWPGGCHQRHHHRLHDPGRPLPALRPHHELRAGGHELLYHSGALVSPGLRAPQFPPGAAHLLLAVAGDAAEVGGAHLAAYHRAQQGVERPRCRPLRRFSRPRPSGRQRS